MDFIVGDVVYMKKPHPCGSREWTVLRAGMDFRIECRGCGRQVMLPRPKFEKGVKKNLSRPEAMNRDNSK
ncbi:MAG: DUF951 domain-containing protein [Clostridiales bacterium]|jgi:hypothetical protein|nr:DUF951 domain-containing protein [Clostridiales bacterium]